MNSEGNNITQDDILYVLNESFKALDRLRLHYDNDLEPGYSMRGLVIDHHFMIRAIEYNSKRIIDKGKRPPSSIPVGSDNMVHIYKPGELIRVGILRDLANWFKTVKGEERVLIKEFAYTSNYDGPYLDQATLRAVYPASNYVCIKRDHYGETYHLGCEYRSGGGKGNIILVCTNYQESAYNEERGAYRPDNWRFSVYELR